MARVENSPQIAMRLRTLAPFEIGFDCKPQRFLKSGETPIVFLPDLVQQHKISNQYGQTAVPLIKIFGSGEGAFWVDDVVVYVKNVDGVLFLDSETQNAYNYEGNKNDWISAPEFPVIKSGESAVGFIGFDKIEIIPRWWEL
jgi:phage-related protein